MTTEKPETPARLNRHESTIGVGQVVDTVRRRIASADRFTTEHYAVDRHGNDVDPRARVAVAWSLDGALEAVDAPLPVKSEVEEALRALAGIPLTRFNDERGFRAVHDLLDEAERRLVKRGRRKEAA